MEERARKETVTTETSYTVLRGGFQMHNNLQQNHPTAVTVQDILQ